MVVTDRGHPVAKIIPFRIRGAPGEYEREKLAREGILIPGKTGRIPKECLNFSEIKDPQDLFLTALLKERDEDL